MTAGGVSRFLFGTLRGRLIVGVATLNAILTALFVADLARRQAAMLLDRQVDDATSVCQALATSAAGWIAADDLAGLQELADAQRRHPELRFALLTDAQGLVHAAADHERRGLYVLDLPREARLTVISRSAALVDVAAPAVLGGRVVGWARVGVGQAGAGERMAEITRSAAAYAVAAIAAGSLLAWVMGRRITRRLYAIQETINAVRGGDRQARSALSGSDEAAMMAREFNAMLDAAAERDARLRASEAKYRELIQNIQAAVVVHGADTRIVTCNLLAQQLLGLSEAQLLGKAAGDPDWRFLRGDGSPLPAEEYPAAQVLRAGKPLRDLVLGVHRPSGDDVTVLVNADPEREEGGAIARVVVTFVDITARRRAERALAERTHVAELSADIGHVLTRRGDLRRILQGCADLLVRHLDAALARIWLLDGSGQVLDLQASAGLYTHLDGKHGRVRVGDEKVGWIAQDREAYVTNAVIGDAHVHDQAWAQREGLVAFAGHPLVVEDKLVGVMAVFARRPLTDVVTKALASIANEVAVGVERKLAEEALRRSEDRYRRIVETAHEGIWLTDAEVRTSFVNRQMAQMLGYAVEELHGTAFVDFLDEEGRARAAAALERPRRDASEQHEMRFRRKDGSELWALVELSPFLDEQGRHAGALAMVTDVTERRRMDEQLRQSQKLEAVGRLAGGVAHDFNNLLTAILGDAEIVAEALDAADPLRSDVLEIKAAANKAALLTRQLLAFGRKQAAQSRVIDLGEVVTAMERMLRRLIGENIQLRTTSHEGLGAVRADPGQIEQVIVNLAVNARDAMPKGGRLTIETANVELGEDQGRRHVDVKPGRYVMIAVSDTGVGMSAEVRAHLFEPFFTTKGLGHGTGLGLATVYGIVKQAGGDVWVYSEPGRGTVFKLYLPRVEAAAEPLDVRAAPPAAVRGTETLLVVEDEPMVRAMAVRVLRAAGYTVIDAADGEAAWRLVTREKDRRIDLLIADVVMPRLGGPELAARLRGARPDLLVLFVSGYTDRALDLDAELGERTAFLSKPFAGADLAQKVREVLDRGRAATLAAAAGAAKA